MSWRFCPRCGSELTEVTDAEGVVRHRCPDDECGFVHYDNPTPVVAAVVQRGDDVILARNRGWPESWFGLVTGFLERGETVEECLLRELREELDVDAEIVDLIGLYTFEQMNQLIIAYHVRIHDEPTPGPELAAIKTVPIARLRPWPMGTGPAVSDWLRRVRPDEEE
jgi:NADH pyrophosphatase NudC (nudix superfamily)